MTCLVTYFKDVHNVKQKRVLTCTFFMDIASVMSLVKLLTKCDCLKNMVN